MTNNNPPYNLFNQWRKIPTPVISLFLGIVVFVAFHLVARNGFVNYDDNDYVTENPHVQKGVSLDGVKWAFHSTTASNWHPLTWLSHMLDCQLWGLKPAYHHLINVLFHALNTILLFHLLYGILGDLGSSLVIALFFGLHPLRVESVAWIAERKDVLSTFFWLLCIASYVKYTDQFRLKSANAEQTPNQLRVWYWYCISVGFLGLGLLSKPMLVTTPFLLLLLDYWPLSRLPQKKIWHLAFEKMPFFALITAASVVTYRVQQSAGAVSQTLPFDARFQNAVVSYTRYLGKLFWPTDLCVCYPHPDFWPVSTVVFCGIVISGITTFGILYAKKHPYIIVGWLWFLGTLIPVIGLVQVGQQAMADRYTYFPAIGLLLALVLGVREMLKNVVRPVTRLSYIQPSITVTLAIIFAALVSKQITYWKNSETLFRHGLEATENNALAHGGLARSLVEKGLVDEAARHYQFALKIRPSDTIARNGLGYILAQKGNVDAAISEFQYALSLRPDDSTSLNNLGMAKARKGLVEDAINLFQKAIKNNPNNVEAHNNLGGALGMKGKFDEAIVQFEESVRLRPDNAEAHNNLGLALIQKRQLEAAITHFQEAVRLRPDYLKAQKNLNQALALKNSQLQRP